MTFVALSCPQCSAPLPRVAIWRAVKCGSCGSLITRTEATVKRDSFRQSLQRARREFAAGGGVECVGATYRLMQELGSGDISRVYLALRLGVLPMLVTMKLSSAPAAAARFAREATVLQELQVAGGGVTGAFFSRLLPEAVAVGVVEYGSDRHALVLRHPSGFWGSLAALSERFPSGLDPRHAVWIWRRILEALNFIHGHGWCHGNVRPEHALVHPQDHAVRLIGWASARNGAGAKEKAADLLRSARVVQVLLCGVASRMSGTVPAGLAQLVQRAGEDADFCRNQGASGLDAMLRAEAKVAFGPPTFVPLTF
jgi:serine/threonine protein kinase